MPRLPRQILNVNSSFLCVLPGFGGGTSIITFIERDFNSSSFPSFLFFFFTISTCWFLKISLSAKTMLSHLGKLMHLGNFIVYNKMWWKVEINICLFLWLWPVPHHGFPCSRAIHAWTPVSAQPRRCPCWLPNTESTFESLWFCLWSFPFLFLFTYLFLSGSHPSSGLSVKWGFLWTSAVQSDSSFPLTQLTAQVTLTADHLTWLLIICSSKALLGALNPRTKETVGESLHPHPPRWGSAFPVLSSLANCWGALNSQVGWAGAITRGTPLSARSL